MLKKPRIRFEGVKSQDQLQPQAEKNVQFRFKIIMGVVIVLGLLFAFKLYSTQIKRADYFSTKLDQYNTNTFQVDAVRGEITDRNYKQMAYNKNVICATYYSVKGITDSEIKAIVNFLTRNCNVDISNVTKREKKDYLIMKDKKYVASLVTAKEKKAMEGDDYDTKLYNLELKRITDQVLSAKLSDKDIQYYK